MSSVQEIDQLCSGEFDNIYISVLADMACNTTPSVNQQV